jgi:hypothetical protein
VIRIWCDACGKEVMKSHEIEGELKSISKIEEGSLTYGYFCGDCTAKIQKFVYTKLRKAPK